MGPKTKGQITKEYFPIVSDRLNMKINITHNFTTMLTWHGSISSYSLGFILLQTPTCPCGTKDQTIDHFPYDCELLNKEGDNLISTVLQTDV